MPPRNVYCDIGVILAVKQVPYYDDCYIDISMTCVHRRLDQGNARMSMFNDAYNRAVDDLETEPFFRSVHDTLHNTAISVLQETNQQFLKFIVWENDFIADIVNAHNEPIVCQEGHDAMIRTYGYFIMYMIAAHVMRRTVQIMDNECVEEGGAVGL